MNNSIHANAGRRRRAPATPDKPPEVTVPEEEHPCCGCPVHNPDIPFCFLPKCRKELFVNSEKGETPHEEDSKTSDTRTEP